jgi:hypothetical protein
MFLGADPIFYRQKTMEKGAEAERVAYLPSTQVIPEFSLAKNSISAFRFSGLASQIGLGDVKLR